MAVMELVLRQMFQGQECIARWNYISSGTPAAVTLAYALVHAFGGITIPAGSVLGGIKDLQSSDVDFVDIEARDVYSTVDFYTRPFASGVEGNQAGVSTSPILAYGYRTSRIRTDVRRGTKRIVGVVEEAMAAGGVITGGFVALAETVASRMAETLTYEDEGTTLSFVPAICGKKPPTVSPVSASYEYWPTAAQQLDHTAQGVLWELYPEVRSQGSRQYGRGR